MSFSLFPALFDRPSRIKFSEQEPDEHIELLLRQHWFVNIPWMFLATVAAIAPPLLLNFKNGFGTEVYFQVPAEVEVAALLVWYMLVVAYTLEKFLFWYFNIYIVTNKHLVDINLQNLMSRDITEIRLADVQSARSQVRGIFGSLFNYGDVIIKTAAQRQDINFLSIPKPDFVADRIQDLQEVQEK